MSRLSYSVVIACGQAHGALPSLAALQKLPAAQRPRQVFVAVGNNPSLQRNLGVKACRSDLVYFLDDDSQVLPETPRHLLSRFEDSRVAVAGGPNLTHPEASPFEKTVSAVLASWLGSFKVRARYRALGSLREATEKELILCNMMVRRDTFLEAGGFRADLYPNEENEFLNRLLHHGQGLIYDPQAAVYRPRRKDLGAFCWQAFRYGRGRAQQMKVYPCLSDIVHLAPAFFVLYLAALAFLFSSFQCGRPMPGGSLPFHPLLLTAFPLILFAALALGTGVSAVSWNRRLADLLAVPLLITLRQVFYGLGLFAGFLTTNRKPQPKPVELYQITLRGSKVLWKRVKTK